MTIIAIIGEVENKGCVWDETFEVSCETIDQAWPAIAALVDKFNTRNQPKRELGFIKEKGLPGEYHPDFGLQGREVKP